MPVSEPIWRDPLLVVYIAVAVNGLYPTSLGPSLPFVASDLDVSKATAALLLTAAFIGSILASSVVAARFHGSNQQRIVALGIGVQAVGALGMGGSPWWPAALLGAAFVGAGGGLLITSGHVLVSERSRSVTRDVSRLNASFAVGAVAGPLWTGFALEQWGSRLLVYAAMSWLAIPMIFLLLRGSGGRATLAARTVGPRGGRGFDLPILLLGGAMLLYVGSEAGLGAWVSSYAEESFGSGVLIGAAVASGYWAALGLGRVGCAIALQRGVSPWMLLLVAIAFAGAWSAVLAIFSGSLVIGATAAFATGLGLGPIWPSCFGIAADGRQPRVAAMLVALGSVGGVVLPFAQGLVIKASGPQAGIGLTALLCGVMFVFAATARTRAVAVDRAESEAAAA